MKLRLMRGLRFATLALAGLQALSGQTAAPTAAGGSGGKARLAVRLLEPFRPAEYRPQTGREKLHDYVSRTIGWAPLVRSAAGAAIGFGLGRPPEWEQDAAGYGKRLGDRLAYTAIRNTITYPASLLLREDNRYFGSGRSGSWSRVAFAVTSPFRARKPDGRYRFSISSSAGVVGANMASIAWSPPSGREPAAVARRIGLSFAAISGLNVFREFVPDILRRLRK
jgi:hypothetical protein